MLLKDKLKKTKLILASNSPRRRELLAGLGLNFVIPDSYGTEETYPSDLINENIAEYLAIKKSEAFPNALSQDEILITADTIVICKGKVLGKPESRQEAISMLALLSDGSHTVATGVALRSSVKQHSFSSISEVWFKKLSLDEIEFYVDTYQPYDKAGAYGIQEWIGYVAIKKIEGSFFNVMGLPVQKLYTELDKFLE